MDDIVNSQQGTVVLEAIVGSDGRASHIKVLGSLDRGGLMTKPLRRSPSGDSRRDVLRASRSTCS